MQKPSEQIVNGNNGNKIFDAKVDDLKSRFTRKFQFQRENSHFVNNV